jgi:signal recognition particle subunit SRP54
MFNDLKENIFKVTKFLKGQGRITEKNIDKALRDIRVSFLEADVNFSVVKSFIEKVKIKALGEKVLLSVSPSEQFVKILHDELTQILGSKSEELIINSSGKVKIVLAGLQGTGKTTTAVKLARFLEKDCNKKVLLIAADLYRPAAVNQLIKLSNDAGIDVLDTKSENVNEVVSLGLEKFKSESYDAIIFDTAGRLHVDDKMMSEIVEIDKIVNPDEVFYVADGMQGQDAVNSSKAFSRALDITGIILTKLDGDSRGGAALSIVDTVQVPIKFIGTGESIDKFEKFHPDRIAKRILGMGDVVTLVETAEKAIDKKQAMKIQKKIIDNSFDLIDFQKQLKQLSSMGSMKDLLGMIPGASKLKNIDIEEGKLKIINAIIDSMTNKERKNVGIINGSRRKRIAIGSGTRVQDVNQLIKQYSAMKKMMKKMNNMKNPIFKNMGGMGFGS